MSRGLLDDATLASISNQLPVIEYLENIVLQLSPDFISMKFEHNSTVPNAAVCLQDTINTLAEARYALHEAIAHKIWYLEKSEIKNEFAAVFFGRFYIDDIALRLYSAGEHLSEAIVNMLEISERDLDKHKKKRVSRGSIVFDYLRKEKNTHPITVAVLRLHNSSEWQKTLVHRNDWVHSQPHLVKGLGIVYKRGQRWRLSNTGDSYKLELAGGDEPEYSIDDFLSFIRPASFRFTETAMSVIQSYVELLRMRGIILTGQGNRLQIKLQ